MSTVLRPVGPQPPRVYWVRRLAVLVVLVLVVVLVVWALGSRGGETPAPGGDDTEPAPTETAEAGGPPGSCEAADLTVTLAADARAYAADAEPTMSLTVTNTSEEPCTVDLGSGNAVVTVVSGSDRIWSDADCREEPAEALRLLDAGGTEVVGVPWSRERSDAACSDDLPAPRPGTYTATATVLGAESKPLVFELR